MDRMLSATEWLETDGLGGFASATAEGTRTRRYHAWLLAATSPPAGRVLLVNGAEVWVETRGRRQALSSHIYGGDIVHPDGLRRILDFEHEPWPRWTYRLDDGTEIVHELMAVHGAPVVIASWRVRGTLPPRGTRLFVRPLLSGREPDGLQRENRSFRFGAEPTGGGIRFRSYDGVPAVHASGNGRYVHSPDWYRNFLYREERARGLDFTEDLAAPGFFEWDLAIGEAVLALAAETPGLPGVLDPPSVRERERARRASFPSVLHRAADAYIVKRSGGKSVIAGYPWFGEWGRDTFIAMRGICLATGRLDDAGSILLAWSGAVSRGMLPNRFPDRVGMPEYDSVDASLWFVIAVHDWLEAVSAAGRTVSPDDLVRLREAVEAIVEGYARGTRFGIRLDEDGLLASGERGVKLTWMDAKIGDRVVTPRTGKAVEVQALWLNALRIAGTWTPRWLPGLETGLRAFERRFWNPERGCLFDVVDADHRAGNDDPSLRPNQILAVGGLPWAVLEGERARAVVDTVERALLTPLGLRSLARDEPGYAPRYDGDVRERDGAYHQGTVWPWLLGPFVEAWVRVRGGTAPARREALARFVGPLRRHLEEAGLGHVSEIADAEPPHIPRGCPFQAWSIGELLRLEERVLRGAVAVRRRRGSREIGTLRPQRSRAPQDASRKGHGKRDEAMS